MSRSALLCLTLGTTALADVAWSDYGSKMDPPREPHSFQKLIKKG